MQILGQAWLVLQLTGSAVDLGLVTAVQFLPMLLVSPYAGLFIEHRDKRRLLIGTQSAGVVLAATLGTLAATGVVELWMVFGLALGLGLVNALEGPTRQVFAFELVGHGLISNAVSLNEVVINGSRVFGPALAGIVISRLGVANCFFLNAASCLPAIWALMLISPIRAGVVRTARLAPRQLWEGIRYAAGHRAIRALLLLGAGSAMIFNFGVALPVLADSELHVGARGYGLMVAVFGIGALGGAMLAAIDPTPTLPRVRVLAVCAAGLVIACGLMPNLALELVSQAAAGCISIWFVALANAALQLRTEPAMRGRVMGLWSMGLPGSSPVGGLIVGGVAQLWGGRAAVAAVGLLLLAAVAVGWSALGQSAQPIAASA